MGYSDRKVKNLHKTLAFLHNAAALYSNYGVRVIIRVRVRVRVRGYIGSGLARRRVKRIIRQRRT